ncbi:MAG: hypothetical protein E6Q46_08620 [Flavobacterium sp.]|nr:MAG: hypothetical protein E6Q46_08620 [Flavobacterium sp.]
MKTNRNTSQSLTPKGVRLNWQPLKEVKPVNLSNNVTIGKFVSERELKNRNHNSNLTNALVP